jgi:hypothetical protein
MVLSAVNFAPVSTSLKHGVPVGERAALAVLAAEADGRAVEQERAEGERLAHAPVVGAAVLVRLGPAVDEALDLGVGLEVGGDRGEGPDHLVEHLRADGGGDGLVGEGRLEDGGGALERIGRDRVGRAAAAALRFSVLAASRVLALTRFSSSAPEYSVLMASPSAGVMDAFGDELLGVEGGNLGVGRDFLVEGRLGEGRLVGLVVPVLPVAIHVDERRRA